MTEVTSEASTAGAAGDGWDWMICEVFGHRRHVGRVREEERFGVKMLRIDIPKDGQPERFGWITHYYSGGSIFSLSMTDEASALRANRPYEPPARLSLAAAHTADADDIDPSEDDDAQF